MTFDLPPMMCDPAFKRRRLELSRALTAEQHREIMSVPLVADRAFTPYTHCPDGHVGEHAAGFPPVNHDGRPHVPRRCSRCENTWLERLEP